MPTYSAQDRLAAAQKAGFPDPLTAVAVSLAEFPANREVNAQAQSDFVVNGVREPSFGPWQIHMPTWGPPSNLFPHGVTQACAMDLTCSTDAAFKISKGGTDFGDWSAFTNGSYKAHLEELGAPIRALAALIPSSPTSSGGSSTGATFGGAAAAVCRELNWLELWMAGKWNYEHLPLDQIAKNLGITVDCLGQNAGRGADAIPLPKDLNITNIVTSVPGFAGVGDFFKNLGTAFRSENLWRAGFLILGAGAIFLGGRMYLRNEQPTAPMPEVTSG